MIDSLYEDDQICIDDVIVDEHLVIFIVVQILERPQMHSIRFICRHVHIVLDA